MNSVLRLFAIAAVFGVAAIAWMILGGVTTSRASDSSQLDSSIGELWGQPQSQLPPEIEVEWDTKRDELVSHQDNGRTWTEKRTLVETNRRAVNVDSTQVDAKVHSDLRRKGLRWYSLYDVDFTGRWHYVQAEGVTGFINLAFRFPDAAGTYDDFSLQVNGVEYAASIVPADGVARLRIPTHPTEAYDIAVHYVGRGRDVWSYTPTTGVGVLRDFHLRILTDFNDFDYPAGALSPSKKEPVDGGWRLSWDFTHVVTGRAMGVTTPQRLQPGELVASLSFSAPVSLLFFFAMMVVLAMLRGIDVHPMNYLMIAAAFFAFHLLFAYTADRLPVEAAFALSSAVSVFLVVSYMKLVVSARFAYVEAAAAQLIYLVGFSLAHFFDGFTGLTITVQAILTLFIIMQLTGRMKWSEVFTDKKVVPRPSTAG